MKKNKLILIVLSIAFILSSCETLKEPKIEYSPVFPLSGEWFVRYINPANGDTTIFGAITTFNDAANSATGLWIRKTANSTLLGDTNVVKPKQIFVRTFTAKATCSVPEKTFSASNATNTVLAAGVSVGTCKVTEGKVIIDGWAISLKHKSDKITFKYEDSRFPGIVYNAEGYRRTGWPEDEPH